MTDTTLSLACELESYKNLKNKVCLCYCSNKEKSGWWSLKCLLSWISSSLLYNCSVAYFSFRPDTTKVDHAIPLRDNWALPYFSCQVAALTGFLSNNISSATEVSLLKWTVIKKNICNTAFKHDNKLDFSVDVLLSYHECHHFYLPPGVGTQPLCALYPRPLSFPAWLIWPGATTEGNLNPVCYLKTQSKSLLSYIQEQMCIPSI